MRILFAGKQHFGTGGIESSTDQLARRLIDRGHQVDVLAEPAGTAGRTRSGRAPALEEVDGYPYRAWALHRGAPGDGLNQLAGRFRPEVVVVNAGGHWWHDWTRPLVRAAGPIPTVLYICDRQAVELLDQQGMHPDAVWSVAESHAVVARRAGHDVVTVPSLVEPDLYRTEPTGEAVLYVNPVKSKGVRTALTLAASRRDIPFIFLRSWLWADEKFAELHRMASALGNIEVAASTPDPRRYYALARVLLAPYDDFGRPRVIAEAQVSGIPVLALDEAGNREAVGPGGLLVARDAPISEWTAALGRLWDDPAEHQRLSEAARLHSARAEMDPELQVDAVERELERTIAQAASRRARMRTDGESPLVSVVLPVRNGAETIDDQLAALAAQTYQGRWELVVSDNGSTDGTRGRVLAWRGGLSAPIRIVDASGRRGVARARNAGIRAARGDLVLICDADDIVSDTWLERMVDALGHHDIVTGSGELRRLNTPDLYEWTGDVDRTDAEIAYGHLRYASGGNIGMRRSVALGLAGFDETLRRAEDVDWSWRAQYAGCDVHFEPGAVIHLRLRSDLREVAAARFRGGVTEARLYRRHRAHGMPAEPLDVVREEWRWLARKAWPAWKDVDLRIRWTDHAAHRVGRVVGSLRHRTMFL